MLHPEDITDEEIRAFLERKSLASLMAVEMGLPKDPARIREFVAAAREWSQESAEFDRAVDEAARTEHHPRMEYR